MVVRPTSVQPTPAATIALDSPPALTSPAANATNVAAAPLFTWSVVAGAQLHKVVVEETGTSWRWTFWVPGVANQVQVPALSAGGLKAATNYRWSVETWRFGATALGFHRIDAALLHHRHHRVLLLLLRLLLSLKQCDVEQLQSLHAGVNADQKDAVRRSLARGLAAIGVAPDADASLVTSGRR